MIDLQQHINEALFGKSGIDAKKLVDSEALNILKELSYDCMDEYVQKLSPWNKPFGSVEIGDKGYDITLTDRSGASLNIREVEKLPLPMASVVAANGKMDTGSILYLDKFEAKDFTKIFTKDCKLVVTTVYISSGWKLKSFKGFPRNSEIWTLRISGCDELKDLSDLPPVNYLVIDYSNITIDTIKSIPQKTMAALKQISVYSTGIFNIDELKEAVRKYNKKATIDFR